MFHEEMIARTEIARQSLFSVPLIQNALRGNVTRANYLEFLAQAYHHVRHTVPLLMSCGARLSDDLGWLRTAIVAYIDEEAGHEEWILADIDHAGGDAAAVRRSAPSHATEVMVSYAYDGIQRRNPVVFFGMAHVLEGTSVQLASLAAETLREALDLPERAFTYLTSHGTLDIEHTKVFADLVNRFDRREDQEAVIHAANVFYRLYADVFRGIERAAA